MARASNPAEIRVLKALRQSGAITGVQLDEAQVLLEATVICPRCGGTGNEAQLPSYISCTRCEGTGQERVIR